MFAYAPSSPPKSIPIVDMTRSFAPDVVEREQVARRINEACRETGFFYVSNHGIPEALIDRQFECGRQFFALPLEEKQEVNQNKSPSAAGYQPMGVQTLDSQDPNKEKGPPDLKESFYCGMELPDDHPWARKRINNFGHNQWPTQLPGFREQTLAYQAAVRKLGDRLLAMFALSLDLPEDFFVAFYGMPGTRLRQLNYPPSAGAALANQLGAGAHTDWGAITILAQDDIGGLEVRTVADEWIQATPIPGTFVINVGDLMQRWTNNLYRSNMHRVRANEAQRARQSIVFFYSPQSDTVIECLPTCTDAEHPPQYAPCTAKEHIDEMKRLSYGDARGPSMA